MKKNIQQTQLVQVPQKVEELNQRNTQQARATLVLEAKKNLRCYRRTFKLTPEQDNSVRIESFRLVESYLSEFLRGINEEGYFLKIEDLRHDRLGNFYCQIV